jgi:anaerobic magnesium-protoporphyrin IX monomethyl ester cyclase
VTALVSRGISVKGYYILGFPTETTVELEASVSQIRALWKLTQNMPGGFRCSAFEFRPYPGTPEWTRLLASGRYTADDLLLYEQVDLTNGGASRALLDRDEFNFSVNIQFGDAPLTLVRSRLSEVLEEQKARTPIRTDHVQRYRTDYLTSNG